MRRDCPINLFHSDERYIADLPDLEVCRAFGATPQEALSELHAARLAWIEAAQAAGKQVPPSRYRPVIYQVPRAR